MTLAQSQPQCPSCQQFSGPRLFCANCGLLNQHPESGAFAASRWRRLGGALLETLLLFATLIVGWFIWLYFAAQKSQTPAKQLLGMYILRRDGSPASAGRVWLREVVIELIVFGIVSQFFFGLLSLLDAVWILWDKDRQTIHDKLADTIVVHPISTWDESRMQMMGGPAGPSVRRSAASDTTTQNRLRELRDLADQGLISSAEYEERRRRILDNV